MEIELIDEGTTAPPAASTPSEPRNGSGHGLVGMRERVALYGGELVTGPTQHGYRVFARLPLDDEQR